MISISLLNDANITFHSENRGLDQIPFGVSAINFMTGAEIIAVIINITEVVGSMGDSQSCFQELSYLPSKSDISGVLSEVVTIYRVCLTHIGRNLWTYQFL